MFHSSGLLVHLRGILEGVSHQDSGRSLELLLPRPLNASGILSALGSVAIPLLYE